MDGFGVLLVLSLQLISVNIPIKKNSLHVLSIHTLYRSYSSIGASSRRQTSRHRQDTHLMPPVWCPVCHSIVSRSTMRIRQTCLAEMGDSRASWHHFPLESLHGMYCLLEHTHASILSSPQCHFERFSSSQRDPLIEPILHTEQSGERRDTRGFELRGESLQHGAHLALYFSDRSAEFMPPRSSRISCRMLS